MAAEQPGAGKEAPTRNDRNGMHHQVMRFGRRVGIAVAGGAVILAGIPLLPLPGPGSVVIVLGLAILSLEFERPRVWLALLKDRARGLKHRFDEWRSRSRDG